MNIQKPILKILDEIKQYHLNIDENALYLYEYQTKKYLIKYAGRIDLSDLSRCLWEVIADNQPPRTPYPILKLRVKDIITLVPKEDYPLYVTWTMRDEDAFKEALASS